MGGQTGQNRRSQPTTHGFDDPHGVGKNEFSKIRSTMSSTQNLRRETFVPSQTYMRNTNIGYQNNRSRNVTQENRQPYSVSARPFNPPASTNQGNGGERKVSSRPVRNNAPPREQDGIQDNSSGMLANQDDAN